MTQAKLKHSAKRTSVTLFLRNIPKESLITDISRFVAPALQGGLFSKTGKIQGIEILVLRDIYRDIMEFHALVRVDDVDAARRAIKKLHAQRFKNKHIAVREYEIRDWHKDRRQQHQFLDSGKCDRHQSTSHLIFAPALDSGRCDRRQNDRRRDSQQLQCINDISDYLVHKNEFKLTGDLYMALMQNSHR